MVLIGGLAVIARVARAHRATSDIDTVFDIEPEAPETVEVLAAANVGSAAGAGAPQRRIVRGVAVDCIDTYPLEDRDLADHPPRDALFIGAHRFACLTAQAVVLRAGDRRIQVLVAIPAGLVVSKLHAAQYRRDRAKHGGDLFDLYRLLTVCDNTAMATAFAAWPNLTQLAREGIADLFVDRATASAGRMRAVTTAEPTRDEDLAAAAELMLELLA